MTLAIATLKNKTLINVHLIVILTGAHHLKTASDTTDLSRLMIDLIEDQLLGTVFMTTEVHLVVAGEIGRKTGTEILEMDQLSGKIFCQDKVIFGFIRLTKCVVKL